VVNVTIDNLPLAVPDGSSVLHAARQAGIRIPTLCHDDRFPPNHSCLVCLVKVNGSARLVPSCATRVVDGMKIESESPEVREARKTALELLLADHTGDCMAPCQSVCPAKMDIPRMLDHIAAGRLGDALRTVKEAIALPAVLGRICPELCEKGCRRGEVDAPVAICKMKRHVADDDLATGSPWTPAPRSSTGRRIAIVGAGPAGLAAAYYLQGLGHQCIIYDEHPEPGGALRYAVPESELPRDVLDAEIAITLSMGATFRGEWQLGRDGTVDDLLGGHDAVLVAIGPADAAKAAALGLPAAGRGVAVDKHTLMTPRPNLFVAGAVITPYKHSVRAVADGRHAAASIHQHLQGEAVAAAGKLYSVHIGRLREHELRDAMTQAVDAPRQQPDPATGAIPAALAELESSRCLHCQCEADRSCTLRKYAAEYGANQRRFQVPRREIQRVTVHPGVVYDRAKCIACGLCIQVATAAGEDIGLTYIGRGFDIRIGAPLNESGREALARCADECIDICPTGALARQLQKIESAVSSGA
jgi:ferredoxin